MENRGVFNIFSNRQIIDVLIGDTKFCEYTFSNGCKIRISMPYLTGSEICNISNLFGDDSVHYTGSFGCSRWQYFKGLLLFCFERDKFSQLLSFLFKKDGFIIILRDCPKADIDNAYRYFVEYIIEELNKILIFSDHKLYHSNNLFFIASRKEIDKCAVDFTKNETIEYLDKLPERALNDIKVGELDSAITKARTLLEETFCYVIEKNGQIPKKTGRIEDLFKQVRKIYKMDDDKDMDNSILGLLSGLNQIITSVGKMRNANSDAHGVGKSRLTIKDYHALLLVNSAITVSNFIISVADNSMHITANA